MSNIEDAVIARLKQGGENFEVLVDLDNALLFREGKKTIDDAIVTDEIFKDVKKGMKASEHEMQKLFGSSDAKQVAEIIIKKGDIQLTAEHRKKLMEEKRKRIISLIHSNSVDPKTNLPHPMLRIENALEEARVKIDEFKDAEAQIKDIIKSLTAILPIRYGTRKIMIKVPAEHSGKCYSVFRQYGTVLKENWESDGSLSVTIEVPAGMQSSLFDELNNITHGHVESNFIDKE